jgi:hypothetical protein
VSNPGRFVRRIGMTDLRPLLVLVLWIGAFVAVRFALRSVRGTSGELSDDCK